MTDAPEQPVGHTAGDWTVAYLDENGQAVVSGPHTEIATCWHHCVGSVEKQMHANARLIAAAPDLLEALIECRSVLRSVKLTDEDGYASDEQEPLLTVKRKAEAAIIKATS